MEKWKGGSIFYSVQIITVAITLRHLLALEIALHRFCQTAQDSMTQCLGLLNWVKSEYSLYKDHSPAGWNVLSTSPTLIWSLKFFSLVTLLDLKVVSRRGGEGVDWGMYTFSLQKGNHKLLILGHSSHANGLNSFRLCICASYRMEPRTSDLLFKESLEHELVPLLSGSWEM